MGADDDDDGGAEAVGDGAGDVGADDGQSCTEQEQKANGTAKEMKSGSLPS